MSTAEDTTTTEARKPTTKEELIAQGWTEEQADYLAPFDAACEGRDASMVIPVTIVALENLTGIFAPDAMRHVATLFSEAALRIGQRASAIEAQAAEPQLVDQLQIVQALPHDPTVH